MSPLDISTSCLTYGIIQKAMLVERGQKTNLGTGKREKIKRTFLGSFDPVARLHYALFVPVRRRGLQSRNSISPNSTCESSRSWVLENWFVS